MSTDRDVTRIVRSWLEEGVAVLPDRVLDKVLDQLPATPQRRASWPAWRVYEMKTPLRLALSAVAILVVAVVGISIFANRGSTGGPGAAVTVAPTVTSPSSVPNPTATPGPSATGATSPTPTVVPAAFHDGVLAPGTYRASPYAPQSQMRVTFTVPAGWEASGRIRLLPTGVGTAAPDGMAFAVLGVGDLYSDPCNGTAGNIPTGTSVDELVAALVAQTAYGVSTPTTTIVSGYSGKHVDLQLPSDVDLSKCKNSGGDPTASAAGLGGYFVWKSAEPGAINIYSQGPGDRFHLWILDIDGTRAVVFTQDFAGTSAANRAALQAIVDSIQIQP